MPDEANTSLPGHPPCAKVHHFVFVLEDGLRLQLAAWLVSVAPDGRHTLQWKYEGPRDDRIEQLAKAPTPSYTEAFAVLNKRLADVMDAAAAAVNANQRTDPPSQP